MESVRQGLHEAQAEVAQLQEKLLEAQTRLRFYRERFKQEIVSELEAKHRMKISDEARLAILAPVGETEPSSSAAASSGTEALTEVGDRLVGPRDVCRVDVGLVTSTGGCLRCDRVDRGKNGGIRHASFCSKSREFKSKAVCPRHRDGVSADDSM